MTQVPINKQVERPYSEEHKTIEEVASESIRGVDEPMEDKHPDSPAVLVFATYPVLLIVGILLALSLLWWWNLKGW